MDFLRLISNVLRLNIVGPNAYRTRFIGFKAELYFENFLKSRKRTIYKGGFFIPVAEHSKELNNSVYYTVIGGRESLSNYLSVYDKVQRLGCRRLFLVRYSVNIGGWTEYDLHGFYFPFPVFETYEYLKGEFQYLEDSLNELIKCFAPSREMIQCTHVDSDLIEHSLRNVSFSNATQAEELYVERLIFDGMLGMSIKKGIPLDIDFIIDDRTGVKTFIEVKEKDVAKTQNGFGLDLHRIESMKTLSKVTGTPYYLVIREVNNQTERKFLNWWTIAANDFVNHIYGNEVEGGNGMRKPGSFNPTKICDKKYFRQLAGG